MFRGVGRNALDLPVAGLAAAAAVFVAFAMPQDVLSQIVSATGLPSLFAAAQPPLGLTARIAIALGGALVTFGLVFFLLRLLDRSGLDTATERPSPSPRTARRPGAAATSIPTRRSAGRSRPPATSASRRRRRRPRRRCRSGWTRPSPVEAASPSSRSRRPSLEPEPAPVAEMPTSIAALMERLEQGLARRQPRRARAPRPRPRRRSSRGARRPAAKRDRQPPAPRRPPVLARPPRSAPPG